MPIVPRQRDADQSPAPDARSTRGMPPALPPALGPSPTVRDPYLSWLWLGVALAGPAIGLIFPQLAAPDIVVRRLFMFRLLCLTAGVVAGAWALAVAWLTLHRANRQLAKLATQDPLTGLANLRRFHGGLTAVLGHEGPSSLIMGDLDNFKRINDQYGHLEGDHVLVGVAAALSRSIREGDLVARIGGEEFAVLLPGADLAVATGIAERMRRTVEALSLGVTISLGVALYPDHAVEPTALVKAADDATYRAKLAGRNQVVVWEEQPASGT
ncbi:MAG: GGDEF domain-containing protein [Thermaerobacter sp.]|nr:GGDEF domain-containing protein [Thermaerobacter sp.]